MLHSNFRLFLIYLVSTKHVWTVFLSRLVLVSVIQSHKDRKKAKKCIFERNFSRRISKKKVNKIVLRKSSILLLSINWKKIMRNLISLQSFIYSILFYWYLALRTSSHLLAFKCILLDSFWRKWKLWDTTWKKKYLMSYNFFYSHLLEKKENFLTVIINLIVAKIMMQEE